MTLHHNFVAYRTTAAPVRTGDEAITISCMNNPPKSMAEHRFSSQRPSPEQIALNPNFGTEYHRRLIGLPRGDCVIEVLDRQLHWVCNLAASLSTEQLDRVHSPYAWTIRQVFEHCANAERVFGARMMRIASGDSTELPDWDENACADSRFGLGNFGHLVTELGALRQANVLLLRRVVPRSWENVAVVAGHPLSLRAVAWITAGHLHHHLEIVEQRSDLAVARSPASEADEPSTSAGT